MKYKYSIVTIDGPAGAGKTTVSKYLANELCWVCVDTGALYRAVAYEILQNNIDVRNEFDLQKLITQLDINLKFSHTGMKLISFGKNITAFIRSSQISMLASSISALSIIRTALLSIQRDIAKKQNAVFEGRDMGTVVFPQANFKFFLSADLSTRALRRFNDPLNHTDDINKVEREITIRDMNDMNRERAPLKPAPDAIKIDSTNLSIQQVVKLMTSIIQKKSYKNPFGNLS